MDYSPSQLKRALDAVEATHQRGNMPENIRAEMETLLTFLRSRISSVNGELSQELIRVTSPNVQHILEEAGIMTLHELCELNTVELFESLRKRKQSYNSVVRALDAHDIPHNFEEISY